MTDVAAVGKAVVDIVTIISEGPASMMIVVLLVVPPLSVSWAIYKVAKALIELRDEVKKDNLEANTRYDNNVELVKSYEEMARELVTQIRINTGTMEQLGHLIKHALQLGRK